MTRNAMRLAPVGALLVMFVTACTPAQTNAPGPVDASAQMTTQPTATTNMATATSPAEHPTAFVVPNLSSPPPGVSAADIEQSLKDYGDHNTDSDGVTSLEIILSGFAARGYEVNVQSSGEAVVTCAQPTFSQTLFVYQNHVMTTMPFPHPLFYMTEDNDSDNNAQKYVDTTIPTCP